MSKSFARSVRKSKQLIAASADLFPPKLFNVCTASESICSTKKISQSKQLVVCNISHCLRSIRFVNAVILQCQSLSKVQFQKDNMNHHSQLMQFWKNMKPELTLTPILRSDEVNNISSDDWGEVGFQGVDPTTDFRGMGLFGLIQLIFFSETRPKEAKAILFESMHPRRFFPFAATGINISAFAMELLWENRLHSTILNALERIDNNSSYSFDDGPSSSEQLVSLGCNAVHEVYCDIYIEFNRLWVERDPVNIMEFQSVFAEVKNIMHSRFDSIENE